MGRQRTVLVTGISGFVGKWVAIELLRRGYCVRGTLRDFGKADGVRGTLVRLSRPEAAERIAFVPADLLADAGWAEAMDGADAVMHTAAAVLAEEPRDPAVVVRPALEGTERVLRFAHQAGVSRVVLTSSIATVGYGHGQTRGRRVYTEKDFTRLDNMRWTWAYCVGKTRAEQAAWTFSRANGLGLTTIHPGMVLGPAADADISVSLGLVSGILRGSLPALPSNGFCLSDVRDVAAMHVSALEKAEAMGQRYLCTGPYITFQEVAAILAEAYPERRIRLRRVPDWVIRLLARFGGPTRQIINDIGNEKHFDGSKGRALLGHDYIAPRETILAAAESLIALGRAKVR